MHNVLSNQITNKQMNKFQAWINSIFSILYNYYAYKENKLILNNIFAIR